MSSHEWAHSLGAVTYDAEYGKQAKRGTNTHIMGIAHEQGYQHEYAYAEQYESEIIVAATAFGVVKEVYHQPCNDGVDYQARDERHEMKCRKV